MIAINEPAERAVLAGLMYNPSGHAILKLGITTDLFTTDTRREAFEAISAFIADGIIPDSALLKAAVADATLIEIETSMLETVSAANLPSHVQALKDCKREREYLASLRELEKAAGQKRRPHELQAIWERIQQAEQNPEGQSRFMDVGELCSTPPAESWLVQGYITTDSLTVLFGDPGCGKSFLAIDIASHVATGRLWRGQPVRQGRVLYIAGEGRNGLAKRFRGWFERYGETPRNIKICSTPIALSDPASIAALVAEIRAMPDPPVLIVIDTINRNFGPGDENSTSDMTRAVAGMDALRIPTGAAIMGLHHSGHADKSRARGSSVLKASTDWEYAIEKTDRTVQARCSRPKDSDYPPPLAWSLVKQPLPWADEYGSPMDSAVLEAIDLPTPQQPPSTARMGTNQTQALNLLRALVRTQRANLEASGHDPDMARAAKKDWYAKMKAAGIPRNRCTDTKTELVNRGLVREEGEFIDLTEAVPEFVPEFVPDLYRSVPDST